MHVYNGGYLGQGDVPVVASNFLCSSADQHLSDCGFSKNDEFCCGHHRDVAIRCNPGCNDGEITVSDGSTDLEGTVKVCINEGFVAVCDDGWSNQDAAVVCRQLGYSALGIIIENISHCYCIFVVKPDL